MVEAAGQISELKEQLDQSEKQLVGAEDSLEEEEVNKEERDSFTRWVEVNRMLRAMKVDEVFDVIEMEEVDEVIMTYPAVCMIEEQRVEKLALVKERNGMRKVLDEKYYDGEMEKLVVELLDLEIYLIETEQSKVRGSDG